MSRDRQSKQTLVKRHYLDKQQRVLRVFVPWRGKDRRAGSDRRCADRRVTVRFEHQCCDRRGWIDRRQTMRDYDGYRIAKRIALAAL